MKIEELKNKRILVWGLGKEGQACIAALHPRLAAYWSVYCDGRESETEIEFLTDYSDVQLITQPLTKEVFENTDIIIKSPGISLYRPELDQARDLGIKITSGTNIWFAENSNSKIIGITGSKGKSTTSSLLAHLLQAQGKSVALAGNIGKPLISFLDEDLNPDYWVVELSSYQLADFEGTLTAAILLNLYPEHLDWHGSQERYYQDKLNICQHIKADGILISSVEILQQVTEKSPNTTLAYDSGPVTVSGRTLNIGEHSVTLPSEILPGQHNLYNAASALNACLWLGFKDVALLAALSDFKPLPHRLQPIREVNEVLFVNDSISTIPESSVAAVSSFAPKETVLILGGLLRNQNWAQRVKNLCQPHVKHIICLGENRSHILSAIAGTTDCQLPALHECETLEQAVPLAKSLASPGSVVLLSPGSASYDQFKSFEARGEKFNELVRK